MAKTRKSKSKRARRVASAALDSTSPTTPNRSTWRCIESIVVAESPEESSHTHPDQRTGPQSFSSLNNDNLLVSQERRPTIGCQAMQIQMAGCTIEAKNQADIASARYIANYHRQNDRPHNTKSNYSLKQHAWKDWCIDRRFQDLDTVTDGKLLLWLQEIVIPQGNQSSGDKRGS